MTARAEWVAEIAKRLSPAQQHALLWLAADGSPKEEEKGVSAASLWTLRRKSLAPDIYAELTASSGADKFENGKWSPRYWRATALGLLVIRRLSSMKDDANG